MKNRKNTKMPEPARKISRRDLLMLGGGTAAVIGGWYLFGNRRRAAYDQSESYTYSAPDGGTEDGSLAHANELEFDFLERYDDGSFEEFTSRSNEAYQRSVLVNVTADSLTVQEQKEILDE